MVKTYAPSTSKYPTDLNDCPEIVVLVDELNFKGKTGRDKKFKIAILNSYRNHKITIETFQKQISNLINLAKINHQIHEFIVVGDFNSSTCKIAGLIEIAHDGLHRHRKNSRQTRIDKVLVSSRIINLGTRVVTLPSVENTIDGCGHKCLVVLIDEKIEKTEQIKMVSKTKFNNFVFTELNENKDTYRKLNQLLENPNCTDPAEKLMNFLESQLEKATFTVEKQEPTRPANY